MLKINLLTERRDAERAYRRMYMGDDVVDFLAMDLDRTVRRRVRQKLRIDRAKVAKRAKKIELQMSRRTGIALGLTGTHGEPNRDVRKPRPPAGKDAGYVPMPCDVHIDPKPVPFTMVTPEDVDWASRPLRARRREPSNKPLGSGRGAYPLPRGMEWKWDNDLGYIEVGKQT